MHLDYTYLPSKYYSVGKGHTYNRRGVDRDPTFLRSPLPLVSRPKPRVVSLKSKMEATSQVGREEWEAIVDSLNSSLSGIDVGLNRQRERYNTHDKFVYKIDDEITSMSLEDLRAYAKNCCDGWQGLINHEDEETRLVCEHTNDSCVAELHFC